MPKLKMLTAACAATAVLALTSFGLSPAFAQPSKTLKIIVPYTPGSGPDIISRLMGEQIQRPAGPPSWSRTARAAA